MLHCETKLISAFRMASVAKTRSNVEALKEITHATVPKVERCAEKIKQTKLHLEAARRRIREDRTTSESKKGSVHHNLLKAARSCVNVQFTYVLGASKRMQELSDETAKIEKGLLLEPFRK